MHHHGSPGARLAGSQLTRRAFLTLTAGAVGGLAAPAAPALAAGAAAGGSGAKGGVVAWINRHAIPLTGTDPQQAAGELRHLNGVVRGAVIVGLGESAHGTHTQLRLKHRLARHLVEDLGFRTIAWEEGWGSGVAIDRYVTSGQGDAAAVVGDALFMLRTEAMLELVGWMREFNRSRPDHDKVRFLGADVLELRPIQFDELRRYVADVAPDRREDLEAHLAPIDWRGDPFTQLGWYTQLPAVEQRAVIAHARAVYHLVRTVPTGPSVVSRDDAVQHAHALLGFYQAYGPGGDADDLRDRYITAIINRWRQRTGHRVIYSAANAHTAAVPRMLVSFPDDQPGDDTVERQLAGGRLRRQHGHGYVSVGISFDHGQVLTGWEVQPGGPAVYDVPPPHLSLVDHVLGQARDPDYLIDLRHHGPPAVRRWLRGAAKMRIIGSAYHPANDANYAITVDPWHAAFDTILHLDEVTPSRLLPAGARPGGG
jgi:erythromycin esterase